jgi:hypothetical protein
LTVAVVKAPVSQQIRLITRELSIHFGVDRGKLPDPDKLGVRGSGAAGPFRCSAGSGSGAREFSGVSGHVSSEAERPAAPSEANTRTGPGRWPTHP